MKRSHRIAAVVAPTLLLAVVGWFLVRGKEAAPVAAAVPPVATVTTAPVTRRVLKRRIAAFGEIASGQVLGVSFARPGRVTRLATVGRQVAKGAALATLAPEPATVQGYLQATAAVDFARHEWQRQQELLKLQLATQSQVDTAEKAYRDAVGNVRALEQNGGGASESVAVAPFDGVVVSTSAALGDRVSAGSPLLQFGHTDVLKVLIGVDPLDRERVHAGTPIEVTPILGPAVEVAPIAARVGDVQGAIDPKSMLISAVVYLVGANTRGLVPGMKVRASLEVGAEDATVVPRSAVLVDEKGAYLFQVVGGKARRIEVTQGLQSEGMVAIVGVSDSTLPVVVAGNYELEDGMAVKAETP